MAIHGYLPMLTCSPTTHPARGAAAADEEPEDLHYKLPKPVGNGRLLFLFCDLETAGPIKGHDGIIEIAFMLVDDKTKKVLGEWAERCNIKGEVDPYSIEVHGIKKEHVEGLDYFPAVFDRGLGWLGKLLQPKDHCVLTTFNGDVCDCRYLAVEMLQHGKNWPSQLVYALDLLYVVRN